MIMLQEFKKNIRFFISMALVLTLLMSAGVSLFNFSFEINKKIYDGIESNFEYGYQVRIDDFMQFDPKLKENGVSYATYGWTAKKPTGIEEIYFNPYVYQFEDYLPKSFSIAQAEVSDFLVAGSLWTSKDNEAKDGMHPIFLSTNIVDYALEYGLDLKVGDIFPLSEPVWTYIYDGDSVIDSIMSDGPSRQFYIKGIYKSVYYVDDAVISLNAELLYVDDSDDGQIDSTRLIINSADDYKKFARHASQVGLVYVAYIEEDIGMANLFSVIFIVLSIAILSLCGLIAFVYCTMFINKRLNFIGLLKALGQNSFQISKEIFILLILVFLTSFIVGNIFSVIMSSHFAKLALSLFDYNLNTGFNLLSQGIFAVLIMCTAFISTLLLNRRINKISIASVLMHKE